MEREQALKFVHELLRAMIAKKGSDLFITAGFPPAMKIDGKMTPVSQSSLSPVHTGEIARSVMTDKQTAEFEATKECNFAISPAGIGRFLAGGASQIGGSGLFRRARVDRHVDIPSDDAELFARRGAVHVHRDKQRTMTAFFQPCGQLAGSSRLAGALQPGHQDNSRRLR